MKKRYTFRMVAFDETDNWCLDDFPEIIAQPIFGIYLFCEGENTYCCEMTPSHWCLFLENRFLCEPALGGWESIEYSEDPRMQAIARELDDLRLNDGDQAGCYVHTSHRNFGDPRYLNPEPLEIMIDSQDIAFEPGHCKEAMRDAAWAEALEYMQGNGGDPIPMADELETWQAYQRAQNRPAADLPLFART